MLGTFHPPPNLSKLHEWMLSDSWVITLATFHFLQCAETDGPHYPASPPLTSVVLAIRRPRQEDGDRKQEGSPNSLLGCSFVFFVFLFF
jgi:hypothetical protein